MDTPITDDSTGQGVHRGTLFTSTPSPVGPTVALCLETDGGSRGVGVSYERGTPVKG